MQKRRCLTEHLLAAVTEDRGGGRVAVQDLHSISVNNKYCIQQAGQSFFQQLLRLQQRIFSLLTPGDVADNAAGAYNPISLDYRGGLDLDKGACSVWSQDLAVDDCRRMVGCIMLRCISPSSASISGTTKSRNFRPTNA